MAITTTKHALLFTIILVSMNGINSQLLTTIFAVRDITDLLENITDTSTVTSMFLANILNQSADTQSSMDGSLDQIANTQTQMASTQSRMEGSLDQIANTQTQMADTQSEIANTQTQMADTQSEIASTQSRIEATLNQMANTQTQMANTLTQVVQLLQMQNQQLQMQNQQLPNMTDTLDIPQQLPNMTDTMDIPRDCSDLALRGQYPSGSYTIQPWDDLGNFSVYCDMDTDNGGWTVFQKRFDGSVDFYLGWDDYEDGFGSPDGEYWLGLRQIYQLTQQGSWMLRIDLTDFQDNTAFAEFESFSIGNAASNYQLSVGAYSGNAGDSLALHNNQAFSTKDNDNDSGSGGNCAESYKGGWWYNACYNANLNGLYLGESQGSLTGMVWQHWKRNEVLKRSEMKMRPIVPVT